MRRKDGEIKDIYGVGEIIWGCGYCRLAFLHGKSTYIVPLSLGYNEEENAFYFHGAAEGKKVDLVRQIGYAGFEMGTVHGLKETDQTYEYSFRHGNVTGGGPIRVVEEMEGEKKGLSCIMGHMSGEDGQAYPEATLKRVVVLCLDVERVSGREQF